MLPKTINNYGGLKVNALPFSNPTSQYGAEDWIRAHEDVAQVTRTITRAAVSFITVTSGDPVPANTLHRSVWGSGAAQKPVVTRTGVGVYVVTYTSSFDDGTGLPDAVETLAFAFPPMATVLSSADADDVIARAVSFTANTFTLVVQAAGVPADVGDMSTAALTVFATII